MHAHQRLDGERCAHSACQTVNERGSWSEVVVTVARIAVGLAYAAADEHAVSTCCLKSIAVALWGVGDIRFRDWLVVGVEDSIGTDTRQG